MRKHRKIGIQIYRRSNFAVKRSRQSLALSLAVPLSMRFVLRERGSCSSPVGKGPCWWWEDIRNCQNDSETFTERRRMFRFVPKRLKEHILRFQQGLQFAHPLSHHDSLEKESEREREREQTTITWRIGISPFSLRYKLRLSLWSIRRLERSQTHTHILGVILHFHPLHPLGNATPKIPHLHAITFNFPWAVCWVGINFRFYCQLVKPTCLAVAAPDSDLIETAWICNFGL